MGYLFNIMTEMLSNERQLNSDKDIVDVIITSLVSLVCQLIMIIGTMKVMTWRNKIQTIPFCNAIILTLVSLWLIIGFGVISFKVNMYVKDDSTFDTWFNGELGV